MFFVTVTINNMKKHANHIRYNCVPVAQLDRATAF